MLLRRLALMLALLSPLAAQDFMDPYGDQEEVHFLFGVSAPTGVTAQNLDWGFMTGLGGTYWVKPKFGLHLEASYQRLIMNRSLVKQYPPAKEGNCEVWSLLVHGVWHLGPPQKGLYLMVGGGLGFRRLNFNTEGAGSGQAAGGESGNWAGIPVGAAPEASVDASRPAASAGLGWETRLSGGARVFVELRYLRVFTRDVPTEMVPLVFGTRW